MPACHNCNTLTSQDFRATARLVDRLVAAEPNTYLDRLSCPATVWDEATNVCRGAKNGSWSF